MARLRKTLLIGLDGGTFDVIDPLLARGDMPNLARLIQRGVRGRLLSTIPPLTAAAWPSVLTGMGPGGHGVYNFGLVNHTTATTGEGRIESSRRFAGSTLFDYVGQQGGRVLGVDIPMCYPPWPVEGRLLASFPTPNPDRAFAYPPEWGAQLDSMLPTLAGRRIDRVFGRLTPSRDVAHLERRMRALVQHVCGLMRAESPDFTMMVTLSTDHFQHRYWDLRRDPPRPDDPLDAIYRIADRMIGRLVAEVGEDALVGVVSDHGGADKAMHNFLMYPWLMSQKLVAPRGEARASVKRRITRILRGILPAPLRPLVFLALPKRLKSAVWSLDRRDRTPYWPTTQAYFVSLCHPYNGLSINLQGREPQGIVPPGEYEPLRRRLIGALLESRHPSTGEKMVEGAWPREEIYSGPFLDDAPDVIFRTDMRYEARGGAGGEWTSPAEVAEKVTGAHHVEGIMVLAVDGAFRQRVEIRGASVIDIAPTLLHAMGAPVPEGLQGRVLQEAMTDEFLRDHPQARGERLASIGAPPAEYTESEEQRVQETLRDLGYIE